MGYVYALDAKSGKLVWKRKVGEHNGRDQDNLLALQHKLKLSFPLIVEPGIVGGVETNMAVADGVVYVPVANLASEWKTAKPASAARTSPPATARCSRSTSPTGGSCWDTKLPQMADGDATVVNDLVFTTTFDGYLIALDRKSGRSRGRQKLPAFTNARSRSRRHADHRASFPAARGRRPRSSPSASAPTARWSRPPERGRQRRRAPTAPPSSNRTARPATPSRPRTPRAPSDRISTSSSRPPRSCSARSPTAAAGCPPSAAG
jgi:hypothetical protein